MQIPFNRPYAVGKEMAYISQAQANGQLAGDGPFTRQCHSWLEQYAGGGKALLTHSCTAALEMAAILAEVESGDEVIMPSYTFVSTANAFVLRGAVPVFVDVRAWAAVISSSSWSCDARAWLAPEPRSLLPHAPSRPLPRA